MKKIIYLIRHSEQYKIKGTKNFIEDSQINNEKIILTVEGEKLAKKLSENEELKNIQEVWSSNYCRAICTAKYISIGNELELNIDSRINERKLGNLETLIKLGEEKKHSYIEEQLLDENLTNIDGESRKDVEKRMNDFFEDILENSSNEKIAVVSHGAAIKYYLLKYCKLNDNMELIYKNKELKVKSPSIFKLTFKDKKLKELKQL